MTDLTNSSEFFTRCSLNPVTFDKMDANYFDNAYVGDPTKDTIGLNGMFAL